MVVDVEFTVEVELPVPAILVALALGFHVKTVFPEFTVTAEMDELDDVKVSTKTDWPPGDDIDNVALRITEEFLAT